jgi:alpha-L-fucosidase
MSNDTVARNRNQKYILPENDAHWDVVKDYIEVVPDDDYQHASEEAFEAFRDLKYTVRIHFGLYSLFNMYDTSWPFLPLSNEARQEYQESYHRFNPENFNADEWMRFFKEVGLEAFAFTTKHHEGFSLYDTKTRVKERVNWLAGGGPAIEDCDLAYSVMETPFKRDIVKELCDAARKHGLKIDLYFSHPDWFDADFRPYVLHPMQVQDAGELVCLGFRGDP